MKHEAPSVFLAPSWRLQVAELLKVKKIVGDKEIVVKRGSLSESELTLLSRELNITPLDWIDLDYYLPKSIAIIVTIFSKTRGSGWFNEAIKFGIPLIVTSPDVEEIMKRTFPQYPFIHLDEVHTPNELDEALQEIRSYTHDQYIDQYNQEMKKRFVEILHNDGL